MKFYQMTKYDVHFQQNFNTPHLYSFLLEYYWLDSNKDIYNYERTAGKFRDIYKNVQLFYFLRYTNLHLESGFIVTPCFL